MTSIKFRTFKHHITGEEITFPYYPECPFAKKPRVYEEEYQVKCAHPNKVNNWRYCLTHHICDEGTKLTVCPYGTEVK